MVEYYLEWAGDYHMSNLRFLEREVIPEHRKDEFMLVRPSVAFLIQQTPGM